MRLNVVIVAAPYSEAARPRPHLAVLAAPWPLLAVASAQAAVFVPVALRRFVDGDEGSYLLAAQLVLDGREPYSDFIYPQMPVLPYAYGVWGQLFGESWQAVRLLSALLAIALGVLLYRHLEARLGRAHALAGVAVFASSSLVFGWLTPVKTYALSTLLLFGAFMLAERGLRAPALAAWAGAGALLALAIDTRLIFAAAVPAFAWAARRSPRSLGAFAGGFVVGLAPAFAFLAVDADRFLFDNLEAQGTRSESGLIGDFGQKARIAANLLGFGDTEGVVGPQFLLLALLSAAALAAAYRARARLPLAFGIAALLGAASFLPTPTYPQYFVVTVPFLIVGSVELLGRARVPRPALAVAAAALVSYLALGAFDVHRYVAAGEFPDARLSTVEEVREALDDRARPGEEVLASWAGYLYGSHAKPVPGMENEHSPRNSSTISAEKAHRYRMATIADVERWLRERRTRLVVFRLWNTAPPQPRWVELLERSGYERVSVVGTATVWERT